jgi:DNA helicase-2/ATP-dependent DNA helicase PcrA
MPFDPTPEQAAILGHDLQRHARVLAGPGTGKSATVVALLEQVLSGPRPPRVKLLTFTRAATGELAQRVAEHPAAATQRPSTIHSFAISVLMRNRGAGGFPEPLRIADDWEQSEVINPDLARRIGVTKPFLQRQLIPEMASGWERLDPLNFPEVDAALRARFLNAWHEHQRIFGYTMLAELPYRLREALRDHPDLQGVDYELLIVDEYQDLNACDLEVLKLVAERGCKIIGTGDDDQSIYGFRWAAPEGIRRFLEDYENASDYPLTLTQRCGRRIVEWANYVIQGDGERPRGRKLRCVDGAADGTVALLSFGNQAAEAEGIAELVEHLIRE